MKCYIVDAFAEKVFEGNPAGVCILKTWLEDALMQNIAIENNLSETAFVVEEGGDYHIRWFTPGGEIELCGHATLASAYVLSNFYAKERTRFVFNSLGGRLIVEKQNDIFRMEFPSNKPVEMAITKEMIEALGKTPVEAYCARSLTFVFENEGDVSELVPNFQKIKELEKGIAVFVTAKSKEFDFVARAFWPKLGVNEDPVCGSMFCEIVPMWSEKLGKTKFMARQTSRRGGTVWCEDNGSTVFISGKAVLYSVSELQI